ncbi:cilia- and flagella-associated protein 36 isoform X3 [Belonocnema kinseyi]|uniref:cilia- and flagella-associated protein 36 isoform X3 n=1 Tax=Belonocnema kinseyi TaxID=2817044 RepID=UPI00143CEA0F|nr:cilia- and flagella-associated protein 36 isoform X3 [Belonocnema kinseyi]
MGDRDESAWVFDSLIGFLQGPIWSAPLMSFIEENSLIFEPDTEDSKEYRDVYQEYKNLVDLLLGCYMEDMGITPEQFERACAVNRNTRIPIQFQQAALQSLFEQIWAANEFEIFKRMMIQKNLELQLQALNMIEQKYGLTPASLTCGNDNLPDEELVMEQILNKPVLRKETEEDSESEGEMPSKEERERLTQEYHNERVLLEKALETSHNSSSNTSPEQEESTSFVEHLPETLVDEIKIPENRSSITIDAKSKESRNREIEILEKRVQIPINPEESIREEDVKKRQDYLKAQRDKLVVLKKQARSQRLEKNFTRPSSARVAAEAAMKGGNDLNLPQPMEPSILQVRRALAARLKAEVVNK